ncbi:MAG: hypothetical protein KDD51_00610 [Bdellovibrionales bacterium]|nr:hypothetical protein [Bdellovibrionales bacterium]
MRLLASHFLRSRTGLESPGIEAIQLTLAPALFGACTLLYAGVPNPLLPPLLAAAVVTLAWILGALRFRSSPTWGITLLSVCTACFSALVVWRFKEQPTLAFVLLGLSIFHLGWVWQETQCSAPIKHWRTTLSVSVRDSAITCLVLWFVLGILRLLDKALWFRLLMSANLVVIGFTLALLYLDRRSPKKSVYTKVAAIALAALVGFETYVATPFGHWLVLLVPLFAFWVHLQTKEKTVRGVLESILVRPQLAIVLFFASLSFLGALFLLVPEAATGDRVSGLDAAFTAVSAVCVTGLIVLDTPVDFSYFGQGVILFLIQVGGLGIMALSSIAAFILGRRLSIRQEDLVAGAAGYQQRSEIRSLLRDILLVTFAFEGIGTVLLSIGFSLDGTPWMESIWPALFTSISAFCNAGFALFSDSLVGYQGNKLVLHTVGLLIVVGGLSPGFLLALFRLRAERAARLQLKAAGVMTVGLLCLGFILILSLEWSNALAGMSFVDRLGNAWFQSVTTRTAGFNSISMTALRPATLYVMMALMFVGGSPGGTAGGIKTTTLFVLVAAVLGAFRGEGRIQVFGRRLSPKNVYKAAAVATAGLLVGFVTLVGVSLTQDLEPLSAIFETVSALGTVGLSVGATTTLDQVGKIIIMFCMFAGRIGPITVFLLLARPDKREPWELPEEEIVVT